MKTAAGDFNNFVERMYNLPLEYKEELKNLLAHNIAETRRSEILLSYEQARLEHEAGKLEFSADPDKLMKML